jgi:hypothetical protein
MTSVKRGTRALYERRSDAFFQLGRALIRAMSAELKKAKLKLRKAALK